jgi:LmbE family N-acetylglucosaminyl deacetylase
MARMADNGCHVRCVALSAPRLADGKIDATTYAQLSSATSILGVSRLTTWDFEARKFSDKRQQILDSIISIYEDTNPDVVLIPSLHDIHQDHAVVASEALRAFRDCTILSYETVRNDLSFNHAMIVQLSREQLDKKIAAIAQYKNQSFRPYFTSDFVYSLARVRGTQIGVDFAEAFEVIKWIVKQ